MIKKPLKVIFAILMCISMVFTFMPMSIYSWADDTVVSESTNEDIVQDDSTEKGIEESVTETPTVEEDTSAQEGGDQASKDKEAPVAKTEVKTEEALSSNQPTEAVTKVKMKTAAVDDSTPNYDVQGSKKASPTTLGSDRKTTVTLSMPSAEAHEEYDVVFAMDSSTSTANNNLDFSIYVRDFLDELIQKDAVIKVGVIKARGRAFDTIKLASDDAYSGLVKYSADTESAIFAGVNYKEADLKALSSGTNMHGALDMANDMLEADSSVADNHKFVILLIDGKTYIWNDDNDEPTSYYTQYMVKNKMYGVPAIGQQTGAYTKSAYKHNDKYYYTDVTDKSKCFYFSDFAELYASGNEELGKTDTKYDHYCAYADKKGSTAGGTFASHNVTNGGQFTYITQKKYYEFTPTDDWADLNYLEAAPYEIINNDDGTYTYDLDKPNPDFYQVHPDSLQKGLYLTAKLWEEMNQKYTTGAVVFSGWQSGSGLEIAKSFDEWIKGEGISDYAAEITEADNVKTMFDAIKDEIIYMVGSGVVTDKITDEFELDTSAGGCPFKMTKDGESIAASSSGDNSWNFGEAVDGVYPYVVEYDESSKTIKWTINVPIENLKKITLSYGLILGEEYPSGTYDTNKSAVLEYTSTDGKYQGEYEFEKPKVTYNKAVDYTLTINYVYANGGTAAKTYTTTLKAGASYGPINSPTIKGYKADRTSVSGVMPEHNVTLRVVYSAIPNDNDDDDDDDDDNPGGGNPGGPGVVPGGPVAATTAVPDTPAPTTNPPATTIDDPAPPLAEGAWALINLISAILTTLGAIIALFGRKEE